MRTSCSSSCSYPQLYLLLLSRKTRNKADDLPASRRCIRELAKIDEKYAGLLARMPSDYTNALTTMEQALAKKR